MKIRKKYFVAHFVTDLYRDDEYEMFYAESDEAVMSEIARTLGDHLIYCEVRKATWAERRYYKRYSICMAH